jgi:FkbM family methyltransferase
MTNHSQQLSRQSSKKLIAQGQNYIIPDLVYSVCTASDIGVWMHTSKNLLRFLPSKHYLLIVPDSDVALFKSVTEPEFQVVPESVFVPGLEGRLRKIMPPSSIGRVGWYLQQFIKLAVLKEARDHENYVIWDADTVPLANIGFFRETGEVEYFTGTEQNQPYFDVTRKLLGIEKEVQCSFIAQCFPCKGAWARHFFDFIENKFPGSYENTMVELINFEEACGFSEYELLGCFVYHHYPKQVILSHKKWMRHGSALIGGPDSISREPYKHLIRNYEHITFERWQEPYSLLKTEDESFKRHLLGVRASALPTLEYFLNHLFVSEKVRTVVQIGANDGIQNDPLRKYLTESSSRKNLLVEPIPHYVEKLQKLYAGRNDITVIAAAAGASEDVRELFFIDPEVADEMNGEGPRNNWAHGQGSFDKPTVIHWINENSFRGQKYVERIHYFIQSIKSIKVDVAKTDSLLGINRCGLLLVIDVQGFEREVLEGIDWANPPEWIVIEDDLGKSFDYIAYFAKRGYHWVAGDQDKVFSRPVYHVRRDQGLISRTCGQYLRHLKFRIKKLGAKVIPSRARLFAKRMLN